MSWLACSDVSRASVATAHPSARSGRILMGGEKSQTLFCQRSVGLVQHCGNHVNVVGWLDIPMRDFLLSAMRRPRWRASCVLMQGLYCRGPAEAGHYV